MRRLRSSFIVLISLAFIAAWTGCGGGTSATTEFDDPTLNDNKAQIQTDANDAELVFTGTIASIGTAPQFWSGIEWVTQAVTYEVDSVLKGTYADPTITVYHVLVDGSRHAAATPGLSSDLFAVDNRLIVFVKENADLVDLGEGWTVPRYMDFDENFGTIPYSVQNADAVANMIANPTASQGVTDLTASITGTVSTNKDLNINGSAADVQSFNDLLDACMEKSSTLSDLVSRMRSLDDYTVDIQVVRDAENVFVDSFTGRQVDIDDLEKWHEGCNDKTDLCQLFGHFLQEYWHAAVSGDGYGPSHESGIQHENKIREDLGKTTTLTAHTGVWQGGDLYCQTIYDGTAELVKIGGGNKPYPESVTTKVVPPAAPTNLQADGSTPCQISLSWTNNAADAEGIAVERRLQSETNWQLLEGNLDGTATSWINSQEEHGNLIQGETFCYRVRAWRTVGGEIVYSDYSNESCATKQ